MAPSPNVRTEDEEVPRRSRRVPALTLVLGLVAVASLVVALVALVLPRGPAAPLAATPTPTPSPTLPTVPQVFAAVGPSVVVIQTSQGALGTGVIASDDGTILTANHVVSGGGAITVTYADRTSTRASVASADAATDIATLTPESLPGTVVPATIGGSAVIGAPVTAIGNPFGLAYSVSTGVVSGLERNARTDAGDFSGLIQFDASVNPGSSGGPLLDAKGAVIGIVVSIADPSGDDSWAGVGFAVPIGAAVGGGGRGPQV